jgi:hypothetical protein
MGKCHQTGLLAADLLRLDSELFLAEKIELEPLWLQIL